MMGMYAICRWVSSSTRDWFLISGKCVWFLCLSTSRKFFIKQWSGGSTDMFCRGCSSECNVKDVLMNQIWIDFGPKLLRNFSGIYVIGFYVIFFLFSKDDLRSKKDELRLNFVQWELSLKSLFLYARSL